MASTNLELKDGDPLVFLQNRFEDAFKEVEVASSKLSRQAQWRRYVAYVLKAIAVFGGFAIAVGLQGVWSQIVGAAITLVVLIDGIWANHKQLLAITEARYAYEGVSARVKHLHTRELGKILELKRADPAKAESQLMRLLNRLMTELHDNREKIEASLTRSDLRSLRILSLEQHADDSTNELLGR